VSFKKLFNDLASDFDQAKEEALREAVDTCDLNPLSGPISPLGLFSRTVQKTRQNGRGYVPDLIHAGIRATQEILKPEPEEVEVEVVEEDEDGNTEKFEAKITQIYESET